MPHYDVRMINVLNDFKYIGEQIRFLETEGKFFIFCPEEGYGYPHLWDRSKDESLFFCQHRRAGNGRGSGARNGEGDEKNGDRYGIKTEHENISFER